MSFHRLLIALSCTFALVACVGEKSNNSGMLSSSASQNLNFTNDGSLNGVKAEADSINISLAQDILKLPDQKIIIDNKYTNGFQLNFSDISLPHGAYLEISNKNNSQLYLYGFEDFELDNQSQKYVLTSGLIFGDNVVVKVIYPKSINPGANDKVILASYNVDMPAQNRSIIKFDERVQTMCIESSHNEFFKRSRSVAVYGWSCTTWGIGEDNFMMTNRHCLGKDKYNPVDVIFNYRMPTCSTVSDKVKMHENTVTLKSKNLIIKGGSDDFAMYTIDDFDYKNAHAKYFFGGLKIRTTTTANDTSVYIPQQSGFSPQKIAYLKNKELCTIKNGGQYNCDTISGASGSPVLDQADNSVVALHHSGSSVRNYGLASQKLWGLIKSYLPEASNAEVLGVDEILGSTVKLYWGNYNVLAKTLPANIQLGFFPDTNIEHIGNGAKGYSLVTLDSKSVATGKIVKLKYRLILKTACGTGNLVTACNNDQVRELFVQYEASDNPQIQELLGVYSWIALPYSVTNSDKRGGLIIKIVNDITGPLELDRFIYFQNKSLSGYNDLPYANVSRKECAALCLANLQCKSFDYYNDSRKCDISYSAPGFAGVPALTDNNGTYDHYLLKDVTLEKFSHFPKKHLAGFNNKHFTGVTPGDCSALCLADSQCKSFDYYNKQNKCDISYSASDFEGVPALTTNNGTYDHYLLKDLALRSFNHFPNKYIAGFNNKHFTGVTPGDCSALCLADSLCKSFDYYNNQNKCDISHAMAGVNGVKLSSSSQWDHYSLK